MHTVIDHKAEDKEAAELIRADREANGFFRSDITHQWYLTPEAQDTADARNSYTMGQLVYHFFDQMTALSPEDITGVPYIGSDSRKNCDTSSQITDKLNMPFPMFSSNMQCTTGPELAITLALMGGIGTIHQFQSIDEQVAQIRKVKEAAVTPITLDGKTYTPAVDKDGHLLVAGATGIRENKKDRDQGIKISFLDRARALLDAGADVIVLDIAHGDSWGMYHALEELVNNGEYVPDFEFLKENIYGTDALRQKFPDAVLMAGNLTNTKAAVKYRKLGVNLLKTLVGPGFACTTRIVTGYGVPSITALYFVSVGARGDGTHPAIPIGDGGLKYSGDIVKYVAAGVGGIMVGGMLAGTTESPDYEGRKLRAAQAGKEGRLEFWGNASSRTKEEMGKPVWDVAEGRLTYVEDKGNTAEFISGLITGLQSGMSYAGTDREGRTNLDRLQKHSRWIYQTPAGRYEGAKGL